MSQGLRENEAEPEEPGPAGPLFVPVRPGSAACAVRLFRTAPGARTAVGFTSPARLAACLGAGTPWLPLSEPALRALAAPLGVTALTVDPLFTAATAGPGSGAPVVRLRPDPAGRRIVRHRHHTTAAAAAAAAARAA